MTRSDALLLDESLLGNDVSDAWMIWSRAAETLAEAHQSAGAPVPFRGLALGHARFRVVSLGGPKMPMMLVISSRIGILRSHLCLISGAGSRLSWMLWISLARSVELTIQVSLQAF